MSAFYWRNRWINALVHQGIERSAAEAAFAATYRHQPADFSKSPEIQAMMAISAAGNQFAARPAQSASAT
jgi:hypothetical protein